VTQFAFPWNPNVEKPQFAVAARAVILAVVLAVAAVVGSWITSSMFDGHPLGTLLLVVGPAVTAGLAIVVACILKTWRSLGRLLFQFALIIFIGAVISTAFGVWLVNMLFTWISVDLVASAANDPALMSWFGAPLTVGEMHAAIGWLPEWIVLVLWPLQFPVIRDLTTLGAIVGLFNIIPVYLIWWERKVAGRIQSRLGPMRVGGWHGWAQSFADGVKLVLKEDLIPDDADSTLYRMAPYFAIIPSMLAFVALPFGMTYVFRELDVALVFVLAMLGIEVLAVILAGWASNNKWSIYGAMREAVQMVSYEIPMGMALLIPVVCVGSLSLHTIADAQSDGWFSWLIFTNPFCFVAFICYYMASLASCKRAPFDLPEAESELVAGFVTEYSGFRWSLFFFAEYAAMFVVCALAVILFLGGWHSPLPASWSAHLTELIGDNVAARGINGLLFNGPIWLFVKALFLLYVQIWLRWTLPRIRIDQVLYACIQVLLPLTMLLLLGVTLWTWAESSDNAVWHVLADIVNWVLGIGGFVFLLGFPAIACYGFYHRRRMVGNLAVDALPAS